MNQHIAAIMSGLPGCDPIEIRSIVRSIWKDYVIPYRWGTIPSTFELFRFQIVRLSHLIEIEDFDSAAKVATKTLELYNAHIYTKYPYTGFLEDLALTPTWEDELYPFIFVLKLFTKRYLYQIYRNTFEPEDMQTPYQEQECYKRIGNVRIPNAQQIIAMQKDLGNLIVAAEQGEDGKKVKLNPTGRERGGWKATLRCIKPKSRRLIQYVTSLCFEKF